MSKKTTEGTKPPTKDALIAQLIAIAHELDWAYFWKDAKRHKKAMDALEEVKTCIKWRARCKVY